MSALNQTKTMLAGRYELTEVIGRGGMGTVYRGRDRVLERVVAVKVLPGALAEDPSAVTRFQREARASAALNHPGVVSVYDTGVDEDTRFIVMECVSGDSLAAVLALEGPLPATRAVPIAAAVAAALAAAHARGIVHRDVKPGNVMLTEADGVKVLDFGIARARDDEPITRSATVLGTAAYLSPEQGRGDPADERSDCYSLGCVVYEMLSGRPPFSGDAIAAVVHQHLTVAPKPLRDGNPEIPAALDALVMDMLAKDPLVRLGRARDVHKRLIALPLAYAAPTVAASSDAVTRPARALTPGASATLQSTAPTRPIARRPDPAAHAPAPDPGARPLAADRRRRLPAILALSALGLVALAVVVLASNGRSSHLPATPTHQGSRRPHHRGAATGTVSQRSSTASTTHTTAALVTAVPAGAASAAAAVIGLLAQDAATGKLPGAAGTQLSSAVRDLVNHYDPSNPGASAPALADVARRVSELEQSGAVAPAAVAPLNTALSRLAVALVPGGSGSGVGAGQGDTPSLPAGTATPSTQDSGGATNGHHHGHGGGRGRGGGGGGD